MEKKAFVIHRELIASGVFSKHTQNRIASLIKVNQATVSRIASGRFKRISKAVVAVCKYAKINTVTTVRSNSRSFLKSRGRLTDPEKKKLVEIIDLAVELLDKS